MALLSAASVMGLFLLLRRTFGRLSAYIWIALSVLNTYLLTMLDRAKGETTMLAFESLSVWMGILFLSQIKRTPERWSWKAWVFLYLSGIFAGAAASGKLNGFSIVGAGLGAVLISLFWMKGSAWKKIILIIGSAAILSGSMFSVFVGLYPYLWPDPIRRTEKMFQERSNEMSTQQKLITDNQIDTLQKRIRVLPKRILNTYATLHFTRSWWVNFPLVLIGLAVAIKKSWLWFCRKNDSPGAFLFILGGLAAAAPVLITPLDWDRYYLLSVYFSTGLISVGFGWLVSIIWKQLCVKLPHHSFTMG
jgi:hypothetical protein